jgi:hypothetical protein
MRIETPEALMNCRPARWRSSHRPDGRPASHAYVTVALAAEDAAIALHVPMRAARRLVEEDPGYLLLAQRWLCPN